MDLQNQEDIFYHLEGGKNSVSAWAEFIQVTNFYFDLIKGIFSDIYRERSPLQTDLKFDNHLRALAAQHLLHLGDLCKFKQKIADLDKK